MQHRNTIPQIKKLGSSESQAGLRGPPTFLVSFMVLSGWSFPDLQDWEPRGLKRWYKKHWRKASETLGVVSLQGTIAFWTHQKGEGKINGKSRVPFWEGICALFCP